MWEPGEIAAYWKSWEGRTVDGRFLLGSYIGGSAGAAVFRTEYHVGEARPSVLKLIPADHGTAETLAARWSMASDLSHPHLIRLLAHGAVREGDASYAYAVMEYGQDTLAEVLTDRALTPAETREMLDPLLSALAYLHGQGFAHGHLTPENILALDDQLKLSTDGLCPVEAESCDSSPAADIYAVGEVICRALTRQLAPYSALPEPFRSIVQSCMRAKPSERPGAARVVQMLHAPVEAPRRERPNYVIWAVAIVVLVIAFGIVRSCRHEPVAPVTPVPPQAAATTPAAPPVQKPSPAPAPTRPAPAAPAPAVPEPAPPAVPSAKPAEPTPSVIQRFLPEIDRRARDTIHGAVRINVRVTVDDNGHVTRAEYETKPASGYLGKLTLEAARKWRFPSGDAGEWLLRFQLHRADTTVAVERK